MQMVKKDAWHKNAASLYTYKVGVKPCKSELA